MTDYYEETRQEGRATHEDTPRRRSTDLPQPLDYPTRELVREIVDSEPHGLAPQVSFIRKLLGLGRGTGGGPA